MGYSVTCAGRRPARALLADLAAGGTREALEATGRSQASCARWRPIKVLGALALSINRRGRKTANQHRFVCTSKGTGPKAIPSYWLIDFVMRAEAAKRRTLQ